MFKNLTIPFHGSITESTVTIITAGSPSNTTNKHQHYCQHQHKSIASTIATSTSNIILPTSTVLSLWLPVAPASTITLTNRTITVAAITITVAVTASQYHHSHQQYWYHYCNHPSHHHIRTKNPTQSCLCLHKWVNCRREILNHKAKTILGIECINTVIYYLYTRISTVAF